MFNIFFFFFENRVVYDICGKTLLSRTRHR